MVSGEDRELPIFRNYGRWLYPESQSGKELMDSLPGQCEVGIRVTVLGRGANGKRFFALLRRAVPFITDGGQIVPCDCESVLYALRARAGLFQKITFRDGAGRTRAAMRYHSLTPAKIGGRATDRHLLALLRVLLEMLRECAHSIHKVKKEDFGKVEFDVEHFVRDMEISLADTDRHVVEDDEEKTGNE